MAPHWFDLGIQLLNENQEVYLDLIQSNYPNDNKRCCKEMFWYWLQTHPNASWQQLIESLKSEALELPTIAADIEARCTGK